MCNNNFQNFNLFILFLVFCNVFCDRIVFPDEFEGNDNKNLKYIEGIEKAKSIKISSQENDDISMPLEMIQKLNSISNVSELFNEFVITDMNLEPTNFPKSGLYGMASKLRASTYMSDRNGDNGEREEGEGALDVLTRSGANIGRNAGRRVPKAAGCIPALEVVSLYNNENRRIFAYPSCTRIERCGGCCQHELLSCQPNNTEIVNYEVFKMEYVGGEKIRMVGREMVSVEKHTECKCGCIVKQKDCTKLQEYRERECRCVCTNNDEETKCLAEIESDNKLNKLWDPHNCVCQCRNILECSSGHFFSEATCQCEAIAALTVRGGIGGTSKQESDQHDYNVYKILPSYRERQRYRNPI